MPAPRRALVALLGLVGVLAAACSQVTGTPTPASPTRPRLTVLLADDWAAADAVVDAIADFEEARDVRVVVRPAKFGQLEEFMIADRTGLRDVDVSQWHAFAAGALGWALPVTKRFAGEYDEGAFVAGAIEDVTWDDEVYGVPLDVNAMVLLVNTDLLQRFGHTLDDLRTWEGLVAVAESAARRDVSLTHLPASTWSMFAWLQGNGARYFERDPDSGTTLQFQSREVRATFEFLSGLTTADPPLAIAAAELDTDADAYPLFLGQQTLLLASGTWDVARLIDDDPAFGWTVVPMPRGPSAADPGTVLGGSSLYITEQADDPALAWDFLTHLVRPEYAIRYARESGRLPGRTDVLGDPFFDDVRYQVAVDQLPHASPMQLIIYPRVLDLATRAIHDVLQGQVTVDRAFDHLQEAGTELLPDAEVGP